jgi:hypothetical protein
MALYSCAKCGMSDLITKVFVELTSSYPFQIN